MADADVIRLRLAVPADVALLRTWDRNAHVVAATGGRPVGVMQIIDPALEETHYWGDIEPNLRAIDIWIGEGSDLGRGYGTEMMHQSLVRCFADAAVAAVLIDPLTANTRAHRFYERLGFVAVGRRFFGPDDCLVYRLDRDAWERSRA
jgi:aminoglycoside 6'-N-acetyltransferase